MNKKQLSELGESVAKQCGHDEAAIVQAFFEALTEANCHNLRYKLWDTYLDYLDDCGAKQ